MHLYQPPHFLHTHIFHRLTLLAIFTQCRPRSKSGIFKPKALTTTKHHLLPHLAVDYVPKTYLKLLSILIGAHQCKRSFTALLKIGTWSLIPSSSSQNLVRCKWIFRIKRKPDGSICHIPARALTTSRARLYCSTILSALGPSHALTVLFLGTHTRTSQWVTHPGMLSCELA